MLIDFDINKTEFENEDIRFLVSVGCREIDGLLAMDNGSDSVEVCIETE